MEPEHIFICHSIKLSRKPEIYQYDLVIWKLQGQDSLNISKKQLLSAWCLEAIYFTKSVFALHGIIQDKLMEWKSRIFKGFICNCNKVPDQALARLNQKGVNKE